MHRSAIETYEADGSVVTWAVQYYPQFSLGHPTHGTKFLSNPESGLQIGTVQREKDSTIQPHRHSSISKTVSGTEEVLIVLYGGIRVHLWNDKKEPIGIMLALTGEIVHILRGFHEIVFLKESKLLEVKQGPYNPEDMKEPL